MKGGERDLARLLAHMDAVRAEGVYVFCTPGEEEIPPGCRPKALFREAEGLTLVVLREEAERLGWPYGFPCACLTLRVHSDLAAVGFLAAAAGALAAAGISCNAVSAWYHDHLFVPLERAEEALAVLRALQGRSGPAG